MCTEARVPRKKIEVIEDVLGSDFVGQSAKAPHSSDSVLILPASFVKSDNGTGIVMSVPAHAPFDYQSSTRFQIWKKQINKQRSF